MNKQVVLFFSDLDGDDDPVFCHSLAELLAQQVGEVQTMGTLDPVSRVVYRRATIRDHWEHREP